MNISVKYDGSLGEIAAGITERISAAISAGAETVAEQARSVCPVDTGALQASIAVTQNGTSAEISANTDYAAYVEFGTSKMAAQSYLVPSLLGNENAVLASIAAAITE